MKKLIIEITQFKLVEGVSEEAFLQDAGKCTKILEKQAGTLEQDNY